MTQWDDGPRVRVLLSIDAAELPEAALAVRQALARLRMDVRTEGDSDVFVGVYGDRYGPIDPAVGLSRLEGDYLAAGSRPRLVYVLPGQGQRDAHLALLLSRIQADDLTSYRRVSGPEELAGLVVDDVAVLLTEAFTGEMAPIRELVGAAAQGGSGGGAVTAGTTAVPRPGARARVPAPWHRLVGRDKEVADVCRLLDSGTRLVTLTGPGGIGKSRLAIEVASVAQDQRPDGAWFVDLAPIRDPALLAPTIAHALGVRESAGVAPVESLKSYLASMDTLLLLDSFETVTAAAPLVVDLLTSCPQLQVFATSRSLLRVRGEHEYPLLPLAVPPEGTAAGDAPALELFLERAAAANPGRRLDDQELTAAAEICRRLEGVPLALELAAARTRLLPPTLLLRRLTRALDELTSGPLDLPERQRTLRTTIDWDHDLLGLEEQMLFRRLAVFPREFTLDAAEAVVADSGLDVMDGLDGLAGKSLLRGGDPTPLGEPTFVMLQSVHDYASERLADSGELDDVARRHAEYVLRRVEVARDAETSEAEGWLAALEHEHADIRAALTWADSKVEVDVLVRLAAGLGEFWRAHCHFSEGRRWLERALTLSVGQRTSTRVDLLNAAAFIARARGDWDTADSLYREGLAIREELGDPTKVAGSLRFIGNVAYDRGDLDGADTWWRRSLTLLEESGDESRTMNVLNNLGVLAHHRGDQAEAIRLYDRTYELGTRYGSTELRARAQMNKATALGALREVAAAENAAREAVLIYAELDDTWDLVDAVEVLAGAVGWAGRTEEAGWLYGGAATLRAALDVLRPLSERGDHESAYASARAADPEAFDRALQEGSTASLEEIVDRASIPGGGG